jgi:6-phosphogluconolactonase
MSDPTFVYVGAYTGFGPNRRGRGEGIDVLLLDGSSGALEHVATAAGVENPSYLAGDPSRRYLYAVNGSPSIDGVPGGAVSAFRIDPVSGHLAFINRQRTVGPGPCHLAITGDGRYVLATSFHAGNVVVFPVGPDGGLLPASDLVWHQGHSVHPERQAGPHAHSVNLDRSERFALVCDLGLDRIFVYRLDRESGRLIPNEPPFASARRGAGPRHLAFHPSGRSAFAINEIGSSLTAYRFDEESGRLHQTDSRTALPPGFYGENSCADVHVDRSGRFVYGSNRGHDSIAIFAFDEAAGCLEAVGWQPTGGRTPRNFTVDPSGALLLVANQHSDSIVGFWIDAKTGKLAPTGHVATTPTPTCVYAMPRD